MQQIYGTSLRKADLLAIRYHNLKGLQMRGLKDWTQIKRKGYHYYVLSHMKNSL